MLSEGKQFGLAYLDISEADAYLSAIKATCWE